MRKKSKSKVNELNIHEVMSYYKKLKNDRCLSLFMNL